MKSPLISLPMRTLTQEDCKVTGVGVETIVLFKLIECQCCREYENLLSCKRQNIDCISQHEEFKQQHSS